MPFIAVEEELLWRFAKERFPFVFFLLCCVGLSFFEFVPIDTLTGTISWMEPYSPAGGNLPNGTLPSSGCPRYLQVRVGWDS